MNVREKGLFAYYRVQMLELQRIERFAGGDAMAAEEAFVIVSEHVKRFLWRKLASYLPNEEDRHDVIQIVLERLWASRGKIEVRGLAPWWAYVTTTGRRCALEYQGKHQELELLEDVPLEDHELIEIFANLAGHRKRLYQAADELWLGVEPGVEEVERSRRLLAAQLFYVHGRSWSEVAEIVSFASPVSRDQLDGWLGDSVVLHELFFSQLYLSNDDLTRHVVCPEASRSRTRADDWMNAGHREPPEGWTCDEVRVAILRFRNGLSETKIAQMTGLTVAFVETVLSKCRDRIPFAARARKLSKVSEPLTSPGLWKRLVFQYHAANDYPQRLILELVEPPAEVGGFSVTSGMLNVWLSNGRLFVQLASYVKKQGGA